MQTFKLYVFSYGGVCYAVQGSSNSYESYWAVQFITLSREVLTSAPLKVTKQELHKVLLVFFYLQKSICIFIFLEFGNLQAHEKMFLETFSITNKKFKL